jgi:hypothetical protein
LVAALAAVLVIGQAFGETPRASAQACTAAECVNQVTATAKGTIGGGILGAEIGFIVPALIVSAGARELDEAWAWILFPAIGAAGGAVAGYFALEDPTQMDPTTGEVTQGFPEAAVAVLAVSMALIVPTFVGVLALTSYSPGASEEGTGASGDEDAEEGEAEESAARSALRRTLAGGPGLLRFADGQLLLGLPMVASAPSFTAEERAHMRLGGMQDLRVPLVSGTF